MSSKKQQLLTFRSRTVQRQNKISQKEQQSCSFFGAEILLTLLAIAEQILYNLAVLKIFALYLSELFPASSGRTTAKGRIEYESSKQKNTGHGKTGTVLGNHCGTVLNAAGIYSAWRHQGNYHPHPRHSRLDFTWMEVRRSLRRIVWADQLYGKYHYAKPYLLCVYTILFAR